MTYTQVLTQRPFNIADGDRYMILVKSKGQTKAFTRHYKNKPIFSSVLKEAKTFKEQRALTNCIQNNFIDNNIEYELVQVKDIFEPRYVVKYLDSWITREPSIKCGIDWFVKTVAVADTYTNYQEAQEQLEKHKSSLVEYHYKKILEMKEIRLNQI